jgi:predicted enzyme related to lactoylglutathione lyase
MTFNNVLTVALVSDFERAIDWYERLFDRLPDRRPMDGSAVWQLTETGGLQVNPAANQAGGATVVIGVADVDAFAASCRERGFALEAKTEPTEQFRLATTNDPDGNMIMFAQDLAGAGVNQPAR